MSEEQKKWFTAYTIEFDSDLKTEKNENFISRLEDDLRILLSKTEGRIRIKTTELPLLTRNPDFPKDLDPFSTMGIKYGIICCSEGYEKANEWWENQKKNG